MKTPGPDHPITIAANPNKVRVVFAGQVIAETNRALTLKEASYPPVQYIPREDARIDLLQRVSRALTGNSRLPLGVHAKAVRPTVTAAGLGPVILINRAQNRLWLFKPNNDVWREFAVATGQAIYPTPAGRFDIVVKQVNPWWYPPTQDAWAAGLSPVPPGPNNPLGTRWMGLSAPGVGIHGTDEPGSIGWNASHGCIRMQVPDAEWLFGHVKIGTTVFIV